MKNKFKNIINLYLDLVKFKITMFVAFSTTVGYIMASGKFDVGIILPTIGVLLLANGSGALNHFQERDMDALMERTAGRPIPSGRITPMGALLISFILLVLGSVILYLSSNLEALLLGWLSFFWYNGVYTPLKRRNALAVVPGSLIGAIPPMIGWAAAGGNIFEPQALALAMFFFIWQIPHFWLLFLLYSKDYEKAGFPSLTKMFNQKQLSRITFVWIFSLAVSCLLIPLFSISSHIITAVVLLTLGGILIWKTKNILTDTFERILMKRAFLNVNLYVLVVALLLSIDKLLLV